MSPFLVIFFDQRENSVTKEIIYSFSKQELQTQLQNLEQHIKASILGKNEILENLSLLLDAYGKLPMRMDQEGYYWHEKQIPIQSTCNSLQLNPFGQTKLTHHYLLNDNPVYFNIYNQLTQLIHLRPDYSIGLKINVGKTTKFDIKHGKLKLLESPEIQQTENMTQSETLEFVLGLQAKGSN